MKRRAGGGSWTLRLDGTRCDGHGICALRCPELITLDERGFAGVDPAPIGGGRVLRRARRAVAGCPERALSISRRLQEPSTKLPFEVPVSRTGGGV